MVWGMTERKASRVGPEIRGLLDRGGPFAEVWMRLWPQDKGGEGEGAVVG